MRTGKKTKPPGAWFMQNEGGESVPRPKLSRRGSILDWRRLEAMGGACGRFGGVEGSGVEVAGPHGRANEKEGGACVKPSRRGSVLDWWRLEAVGGLGEWRAVELR
jgi:hypothetical protein